VSGYQTNSGALTNYTYHHDALESVLGQSGNTGTVVAAQGYTSFGSTVNATGTSNNTLKFTGREQDIETGLIYYRARYYDPLTGRFLSEDPIRSGINYYTYCGNNPVNCNDPFGLTQHDIDVAYQLIQQTYPDLKFPSSIQVGPVPGTDNVGANLWVTNFNTGITTSQGILISNAYLGVLSNNNISNTEIDAPGLLDTIIHELIHFYWPFNDDEHQLDFIPTPYLNAGLGFPYTEAARRTTPGLINQFNQLRKQNGGNTSTPAKTSGNSSAIQNAANAVVAAVNSAMDNINSMLNPPVYSAKTGTVTVGALETEDEAAADGGFILYPNMSNTNQIQSVYSKH
jgi:RHS repeat-associated protein